jgi:hypothetical protein
LGALAILTDGLYFCAVVTWLSAQSTAIRQVIVNPIACHSPENQNIDPEEEARGT